MLTIGHTTSPADPAKLSHDLRAHLEHTQQAYQQVEELWQQHADGTPVSCAASLLQVEVPAIFVLRSDEARTSPQLAEAAGHLNYAIDQIAWAVLTWESLCDVQAPAPGTLDVLAEGAPYVTRAQQALNAAAELLGAP